MKDKYDIILEREMKRKGFKKINPDTKDCTKTYFQSSRSKHIILAYDLIYNRIGVYFMKKPIEQFFIGLQNQPKKTFSEWLADPKKISQIELTIMAAKSYLRENKYLP